VQRGAEAVYSLRPGPGEGTGQLPIWRMAAILSRDLKPAPGLRVFVASRPLYVWNSAPRAGIPGASSTVLAEARPRVGTPGKRVSGPPARATSGSRPSTAAPMWQKPNGTPCAKPPLAVSPIKCRSERTSNPLPRGTSVRLLACNCPVETAPPLTRERPVKSIKRCRGCASPSRS